jgi:hypothetical protein
VLAGVLLLVVLNAWWYWSHRRGFPLFIDEAGYTSFALDHTHALRHDGLIGLFQSVEDHAVHAPLVPVLTVPLELLFGDRIGSGFIVIAAFHALLVAATYGVARRITRPWPSALAALIVACAPGAVTFAHMYYFAVPSAALFTTSLFCFLRSDALDHPPWALAGGATLGLAALTRTLVLALVLGPLVAMIVQACARDGQRWRRMLTLGAAILTAAAIGAIWYGPNFSYAVDFLRGARFRDPSSGQDPYHLHHGARELRQLVETVQVPFAVLLAAVFTCALIFALSRQALSAPSRLRRSVGDDRMVLVIVLLEALAVFALADEALGQWLNVLPVVIALAVGALSRLPRPRLRAALAGALVLVAVVDLAMLSGISPTLGQPRTLHLGPLGPLTITDGRQDLQRRFESLGDTGRPGELPASFRKWPPLHIELTKWLLWYAAKRHQRPVVFTAGNESRLLNLNDLLLSDRLLEDRGVLLVGRIFRAQHDSPGAYRAQLTDPKFGLPNFVITLQDRPSVRNGTTTPPLIERELRAVGFMFVRKLKLPDGVARIWWRSQADVPRPA